MKRGRFLLVDTHAHLADAGFDADRDDVIARAFAAGVGRMITVATDLASSLECLQLAARHEHIGASTGIHPSRAASFDVDGEAVRDLITKGDTIAVGEIGLDYGRPSASREQQLTAFRTQVRWAVEAGLPVLVHDRDAHDDIIQVLSEFGARGVLHCFSGDAGLAHEAIALNLFVSFAGNVTYKNATELHEAVRVVPEDRLLLETDSPYLAPRPWRGERNEPAHITAVAERVAELRGCSVADVERASTLNAQELFGWFEAQALNVNHEPATVNRRID